MLAPPMGDTSQLHYSVNYYWWFLPPFQKRACKGFKKTSRPWKGPQCGYMLSWSHDYGCRGVKIYSFVLDALGLFNEKSHQLPRHILHCEHFILNFFFFGLELILNGINFWKSLRFAWHIFVYSCSVIFSVLHCITTQAGTSSTKPRACRVNTA